MGLAAVLMHILGIVYAYQAITRARTSQGATAWAIFLLTFPYVGVPLFWIFGRDRFNGYVLARQLEDEKLTQLGHSLHQYPAENTAAFGTMERLADMAFSRGNRASLLVDGKATFEAIFAGIDGAKEYLLVQFFIVNDDELGRTFKAKLIGAAGRGVRVYFLFDGVGSHSLPKRYVNELRQAGVDARAFKTNKGANNRFQLNFRNHRKIVVTDGTTAYVGGHNVGDEYVGKDVNFGRWRDTHVKLEGPTVSQVQLSFLEDWHWSEGAAPKVQWEAPSLEEPGMSVLALPTGPADQLDTCALFFLEAIRLAKRRIWITSPYFVPDLRIVSELQLAVMRGVDVRILLPDMADHFLVYLASFAFLKDILPWGIQLFRFKNGFLHQKVLLVDDDFSAVGTANFDNRSFRLNFEISILFADKAFNREVEAMLVTDFAGSVPVKMDDLDARSWALKFAVHVSRLLAPIL